MSETKSSLAPPDSDTDQPGRGPNLTVIYSLIVLAMIAAVAIALFIVLPFYNSRH